MATLASASGRAAATARAGGCLPLAWSLPRQENSPGTASNCSGPEPSADQKAPDGVVPDDEQQQIFHTSDPSVSQRAAARRLEILSLADDCQSDEQQHAQAHSGASAKDSESAEHSEQSSAASNALSDKQPLGELENQPMHGSSAGIQHSGPQSSTAGQQMESRYVHGVYDIIAGHFSATRFAIWPKVSCSRTDFATSLLVGVIEMLVGS